MKCSSLVSFEKKMLSSSNMLVVGHHTRLELLETVTSVLFNENLIYHLWGWLGVELSIKSLCIIPVSLHDKENV
jgi:hypothetical protein